MTYCSMMSMWPYDFSFREWALGLGVLAWCWAVSDYFKGFLLKDNLEGEALIGFGLWCLLLWWFSKRYGKGFTPYWFIFAAVSYMPFADIIDATFGGALGLKPETSISP